MAWLRGVVALVLASAVLAGPGAAPGAPASGSLGGSTVAPQPAAARLAGDTPTADALEDRMLTTRPALGPTWVVRLAGESAGRILLARTLQGLVNRSSARLYLLDGGDGGGPAVLARYEAEGLVDVQATVGLDEALDLFAAEASGYVVADAAEPWSVHAAAVIASIKGALVASPAEAAALQARGLAELDDTRGRWSDGPTAYRALADTYGDQLASRTIAVVRPTDTLWDFVLQQGLLPIFTRPADPSWETVTELFEDVPDGSPVYGYLSDTGDEEVVAVAALAATELVLVPTDTTRNLSFHIAVGADQPRVRAPMPAVDDVAPCTSDTVNVVVALTDGDNPNVPLNHFLRPSNWDSPRRGDIPLGWSMSPGMAVLAPAAWDIYAREAGPDDELVSIIGWGYGAPALLADPDEFYRTSFALQAELGMDTFWSLGGGLDSPDAPFWGAVDAAAGDGPPTGLLVSYGNGVGAAFHSPAGRPAFTSRSVYSETPSDLAAHVADLVATPPSERPAVTFLSATNWTNPAHDLIAALAPFEEQGVRFLTPSEATACAPPPDPVEPPPPGTQACSPQPPLVPRGLPLISSLIAAEVEARPTPFALPVTAVAPATATAGERADLRATVTVDLPAFVRSTLDDRVRPVIEAGYGSELADSAWMRMAFGEIRVAFPRPPGTRPDRTPAVSASDGSPARAVWTDDALIVSVGPLTEDSRAPGAALTLDLRWGLRTERPAPAAIEVRAEAPSFDLALDLGVTLGDIALQGGVGAAWTCGPAPGALASITVTPGAPVDPVDPPDGSGQPPTGPSDPPPVAAPPASPISGPARFTG